MCGRIGNPRARHWCLQYETLVEVYALNYEVCANAGHLVSELHYNNFAINVTSTMSEGRVRSLFIKIGRAHV